MILFLDTETTGLTPMDRIVSLCWSFYDLAGREVRTSHHLVYPADFTIPTEVSRIHGITTAIAIQRGVPLSKVLAQLRNEIQICHPELYVGHNVSFDRPIVLNEFARTGLEENLSNLPTFCTMKSTTQLCRLPSNRGGYKWPKLAELHEHLFGQAHEGAHDAAADVGACARCYFELRARRLIR